MTQVFGPQSNLFARLAVAGVLVGVPLALLIAYAVARSSWSSDRGVALPQPVPFSHRHHVGGLGIDCRYCHAAVERSAVAGLPSTDVCMTCHSQLWTGAAMLEPVRESLRSGEPLAWRRVHDLPDFVYFDHGIHVSKGVACETCHGRVDRMALTAKAHDMHMSWCLDCHRRPDPRLRPREAVFEMGWSPPRGAGERPAPPYHLARDVMLDCSTCHR